MSFILQKWYLVKLIIRYVRNICDRPANVYYVLIVCIQCFSSSGPTSINCTFVGSNSCGYSLVSSSSNLELSYKFNDKTGWCHLLCK